MNDAYLATGKKFGTPAKGRIVAAHELGHTLGFCHKSPRLVSDAYGPER
ncbi:hypothetical protein AB0A69_32675 [Streptomyces sp. NPDC045431]